MPYRVRLTKRARRRLDALPEDVRAALLETIVGPLAENPRRLGHPLQAPLEGQYSARRGEYRILYRIDDDERIVYILTAGHHRDVYRPG
jgi:mRNA interferase RelE/StbE